MCPRTAPSVTSALAGRETRRFSAARGLSENTFAFYRKWLKDVVLDQTEEGGIPHVVPDLLTGQSSENWLVKECPHSASAWADVITIMP